MRSTHLVFLASLVFSCGGIDRAPDGDNADFGKEESCADCATALDDCLGQELEDGAAVNACFGTFASCVFDTTGKAIDCPPGNDCGECFEDCHEQTLSRDCAVRQSGCILVDMNLGEAAAVCPAPPPETCQDCQAVLEACSDGAEDGFEINQCLGEYARCYFDTVGDSVGCPEGADCGECDQDCREQEARDCAVHRSECILVNLGLDVAATECPAAP